MPKRSVNPILSPEQQAIQKTTVQQENKKRLETRLNKVFGIGFPKTATCSLTAALNHLGIRTIHCPPNLDMLRSFRGATDCTIASLYQYLDYLYPNAQFILTIRDEKSFARSFLEQFSKMFLNREEALQMTKFSLLQSRLLPLCGSSVYHKFVDIDTVVKAFLVHNKKVTQYFAGQSNKLLVINLFTEKNPWKKICDFLKIPEAERPTLAFPRINTAENRIKNNHAVITMDAEGDIHVLRGMPSQKKK